MPTNNRPIDRADLRVHTEPMKWTDNANVRNMIQAVQRDGATEVRYSGDLPGEYFCIPVSPEGKELALCILRTDEFNKLRAWLKNVAWVDVKKQSR